MGSHGFQRNSDSPDSDDHQPFDADHFATSAAAFKGSSRAYNQELNTTNSSAMADPNDVQIQVPSEAATTLPPAQDAPTLAAPQLAPAAPDGQISVEHAAAPLPDLVKPHAGVQRGGGSGDMFQSLKMTLFSP